MRKQKLVGGSDQSGEGAVWRCVELQGFHTRIQRCWEDVTLRRTVGALQEPRPGAEGDIARDGVGRELSVAAQSFPASHVSLPEKSLKSTEH